MKKLKLLTLLSALVMGLSLTSCLDSGDSGTTWDDSRRVYVQNYLGQAFFVDIFDNRYFPSSESLAAFRQNNPDFDLNDYEMMDIYFNYHVEEETTTTTKQTSTTPQTYEIDLIAYMVIEVPEVISVQTTAELEQHETAPVVSLEQNTGYGITRPQQFDERMILAYTGFWLSNDAEKLDDHKFRLVYVRDEITSDSKDLVVYVCHNRGDDEGTSAVWATTCGLDLERALNEFRQVTGGDPDKVIIKAKTSNYATTTLPTDYTEYELEYQTLEELYPSAF